MEGPSHLLPRAAHGGGKFPVWSYQHPASSPLFPAFKSLLPFYSPQRLEVLARRGWGSAGSPGGWSPGCGRQGVVCVTQVASGSSAGWSGLSWQRADGHPDPGRPLNNRRSDLCPHLVDAAAGRAFFLLPPRQALGGEGS